MRESLKVKVTAPQYSVVSGATFAQVDAWFGHTRRDLKMDIIYPEDGTRKYPCVVWICGGAWQRMDRSAHLAYLSELARCGFVVASVEYRTSNEDIFPAQLTDVKAGIRYLKAMSERYHIDTERFGVMGESAGGYLAAMAALATPSLYPAFSFVPRSSAKSGSNTASDTQAGLGSSPSRKGTCAAFLRSTEPDFARASPVR